MRSVIVKRPQNNSLIAQLIALEELFTGVQLDEEIQFELSALNFCFPLLILPISAYINDLNGKFTISDDHRIKSYLDTISFPKGIDSVTEFATRMQTDKTYVPISRLKRKMGIERERLEAQFLKKLNK